VLKKLLVTALVVGGVVVFVGADVVGSTVRRARDSVRASLTSSVPLRAQVAEARAQIDRYAENVIRGEIAADALADTVARTEREVRARRAGVERERTQLASLRTSLEQRTTATLAVATADGAAPRATPTDEDRETVRRAREYQAATAILERREQDLAALKRDHDTTMKEVAAAKAAQARLAEEVTVLQAEVEALEARTSVAQTRKACDATIDRSGFGDAQARIEAIRAQVREQDRRLEYYARKSEVLRDAGTFDPFAGETAVDALRAALDTDVPTTTAVDAR
jgi:predicted  nucleic acid-binding Zn-ribbon protein